MMIAVRATHRLSLLAGVCLVLSVTGCTAFQVGAPTGGTSTSGSHGTSASPTSTATTATPTETAGTTQAAVEPSSVKQTDTNSVRLLKPGDPERQAVLDAVRVVVEKDLGQRVVFEVRGVKVVSSFAGLQGRPVQPDGDSIDYMRTHYASQVRFGAFDDGVLALLVKRNGRWRVLECEVGMTDYPGEAWLQEHKVPGDVFALDSSAQVDAEQGRGRP
jgi:hypothetical protein